MNSLHPVDVTKAVCEAMGIAIQDVCSTSRERDVVAARRLISLLTATLCPMHSTPEVAAAMGQHSHTTVVGHRRLPDADIREMRSRVAARITAGTVEYHDDRGRPISKGAL